MPSEKFLKLFQVLVLKSDREARGEAELAQAEEYARPHLEEGLGEKEQHGQQDR